MTTDNRTPCSRPGCDGALEDGYCDSCGLTATPPTTAPPTAAPPTALAASSTPERAQDHESRTTAAAGTASGTASSRTSRRSSTRTTGPTRSRLGAGLVEVPPVPHIDPATALLADPQVTEDKRFCSPTPRSPHDC
jgi:serine/threonine-protein kinase PknG